MLRLMGAVTLLMVATANLAQAETRILLNCFPPSKHAICKILGTWGSQVEDVTEGRVRVTIPAKSMAPPPEQLNSVRGGLFDASFMFLAFGANEIAGPLVSMNPFTSGPSSEANSTALWQTYDEFFGDRDEFEGVKLLGLAVNPGANFYSMTDEPIASLDPMNAQVVMQSLRDIHEEDGRMVIANLHTLDTARRYCDRVIGMRDGRIVFDGTPEQLTTGAARDIYGAGADFSEAATSTEIETLDRSGVPEKVPA